MKKGFTLIELLIVIAIIAILALIAIPNFMEARVRANVARVQADMRGLATGMEAYMLDHNNYPMALYYFDNAFGTTAGLKRRHAYLNGIWNMPCLSTPVAYISSVKIEEPFMEKPTGAATTGIYPPCFLFLNFYGAAKFRMSCPTAPYDSWETVGGWANCPSGPPWFVAPIDLRFNSSRPEYNVSRLDQAPINGNFSASGSKVYLTNWALMSPGPDKSFNEYLNSRNPPSSSNLTSVFRSSLELAWLRSGETNFYDPSNGSNSQGNIWRLSGAMDK